MLGDDLADPQQQQHANHLYNQVALGQVSMQSIVDDWIESYKKDKDAAMLDLIKFLIRCAGCKAVTTNSHLQQRLNKDLLKTKEFTDVINDLVDSYNDNENEENATGSNSADNDIVAYPLVQTSVQARRFKANFGEFLQLLINQCQYSIVYDQFMLDVLISFLIGVADSQVRAFRHTATLAVLKVSDYFKIRFLDSKLGF